MHRFCVWLILLHDAIYWQTLCKNCYSILRKKFKLGLEVCAVLSGLRMVLWECHVHTAEPVWLVNRMGRHWWRMQCQRGCWVAKEEHEEQCPRGEARKRREHRRQIQSLLVTVMCVESSGCCLCLQLRWLENTDDEMSSSDVSDVLGTRSAHDIGRVCQIDLRFFFSLKVY